jgi:hypothetical protein
MNKSLPAGWLIEPMMAPGRRTRVGDGLFGSVTPIRYALFARRYPMNGCS